MTIYLYKKTHNITGLKYLGKTTKDPFSYNGSGKDWKSHLKQYGINITTEILKECHSKEDLNKWGRYYSKLWNVVDNKEWANRIPETGGGGSPSEQTKEKLRNSQLGKSKPSRTDNHKKKLSDATKGICRPRTSEHQEALTEAIKNNWQTNTKRKLITAAVGKSNLGRKQSKETLEKRRIAMINYWQQKKLQSF